MRFTYFEPTSIEEALSMLEKKRGRACIIAGGTDLLVQTRNKSLRPEAVIDLSYIPGMAYIKEDAEGLKIGSMTIIRDIEKAKLQADYGSICKAAGLLGSVAIRNMATIGGNLCHGSPCADMAPILIGLDARVKLVGSDGDRVIALEDFFKGPGKTALKDNEVMVEIQLPAVAGRKATYLKYGRSPVDLATVSIAIVVNLDSNGICQNISIVMGAVAPVPMRAKLAEAIIQGDYVSEKAIEQAAQSASDEAQPITDIRASARYRRDMVRLLTIQALTKLITVPGGDK